MDINYNEMPAGRELDALVAERVMGWTRSSPDSDGWLDRDSMFGASAVYFCPSTNIAAAWRVVEKLRTDLSEDQWEGFANGLCEDWQILSPDAPLLVCREALKAVAHG